MSGSGVCEDASHICTPTTGKGGPLAKAVAATDGSISYVDLATARKEKFSEEKGKVNQPIGSHCKQSTRKSPKAKGSARTTSSRPRSPRLTSLATAPLSERNCTKADYRGLPTTPASDPTLGDWSNAIATGSTDTTTYPACAITYDLAFDDDAPVFGNTPQEQERARTVKDYLTAVESPVGQSQVSGADYGVLPLSIQSIARKGVEAIGWDKAAGAGGGKTEEKPVTPPAKTTTTTTTTQTVTPPPSNTFSVASAKVKGKDIVLSLQLPDPGKIQVKATGGGVSVSNVSASVSGGSGTVTLAHLEIRFGQARQSKGAQAQREDHGDFHPDGRDGCHSDQDLDSHPGGCHTRRKKQAKARKRNKTIGV